MIEIGKEFAGTGLSKTQSLAKAFDFSRLDKNFPVREKLKILVKAIKQTNCNDKELTPIKKCFEKIQ